MNPQKKVADFASFSAKAIFLHTLTYMVFGLLARALFHYDQIWEMPIMEGLYRPMDSRWVLAGPFLQPLRGLIYAIALWPFVGRLREMKLGGFAIWLVFLVFAIWGTCAAAPGSVEGVIYTRFPLFIHAIGIPEVYGQTLAFSLLLHYWDRHSFLKRQAGTEEESPSKRGVADLLKGLLTGFIGYATFAATGGVVAVMMDLDVSDLSSDRGAILLLGLLSLFYVILAPILGRFSHRYERYRAALIFGVYYLLTALLPAGYNVLNPSPLHVWTTFLSAVVPSTALTVATVFLWRSGKTRVTA